MPKSRVGKRKVNVPVRRAARGDWTSDDRDSGLHSARSDNSAQSLAHRHCTSQMTWTTPATAVYHTVTHINSAQLLAHRHCTSQTTWTTPATAVYHTVTHIKFTLGILLLTVEHFKPLCA